MLLPILYKNINYNNTFMFFFQLYVDLMKDMKRLKNIIILNSPIRSANFFVSNPASYYSSSQVLLLCKLIEIASLNKVITF